MDKTLVLDTIERDPYGTDQHAPGAKLDQGKARVWLMLAGFSRALEAVADVTTYGAEKYSPDGWLSVPDGYARYMDALGRHLLAHAQGRVLDVSGCLVLAQVAWNALAALELDLRMRQVELPTHSDHQEQKP